MLGVKKTLTYGLALVGTSSTLFGFLHKINNGDIFLGLSLMLRAFGATGHAAFFTGSLSTIAAEFPDKSATMFSITETFFGLGLILGPTVGGILYEVGGFWVLSTQSLDSHVVRDHRWPGSARKKETAVL